MLDTSRGFAGIVSSILKIFDVSIPVLVALALILFMVGVVKYIYSEGEHKNREIIVWSLVALFVIVSVWGILRLMCNTLTGNSSCATASNSTGVNGYFGNSGYQNANSYGGPR